jgi:hypothetical protein
MKLSTEEIVAELDEIIYVDGGLENRITQILEMNPELSSFDDVVAELEYELDDKDVSLLEDASVL